MNFPIIMSLWLMRQGLDDDTDLEALASALSQFMNSCISTECKPLRGR